MSPLTFVLVFLLGLLSALPTINAVTEPGNRRGSCSFGYNNSYYLLGGFVLAGGANFLSTPLPIISGVTTVWTALPDPPQWVSMTSNSSVPQFDCSVNYDGRVFLFGNAVGFAVFDIPSGTWSTPTPTFQSSITSLASFQNLAGIKSAVHPDGYTISIFIGAPATYMELYSRNMTIASVTVPGFPENLHGFCMGVVPTVPPTPVVCGGSNAGSYTDACWQFGLSAGNIPHTLGTLPIAQDGCALVAFGSKLMVVPGYLAYYHTPPYPAVNSSNPNMELYDVNTMTWSSVNNIQGTTALPLLSYATATIMPGTTIAIIYGGVNPVSGGVYGEMGAMDLSIFTWIPMVSVAANPFPTPSPSSVPSKSDSSTGAIAGGAIGGVVVLGALAGFLFYKKRRPQNQPLQQQHDQYDQRQDKRQSRAQDGYRHDSEILMEEQTYKYTTKENIETTPEAQVKRVPRGPQAPYTSQSPPQNPQAILY